MTTSIRHLASRIARILSPWVRRGFAHGFALPLVGILPVHGLEFALYRSPLDLILRSHWEDGVRWAEDFHGSTTGMAVSTLLVVLVGGDAFRRWFLSWRSDRGIRLDLFWEGLVVGISGYVALRQVGTMMQWQHAGLQAVSGIRMALFGGLAVWMATSIALRIHPGSRAPRLARWIGLMAVVLISIGATSRWQDLLRWNLERTALRTGDPEDFDQWLFQAPDSLERSRILGLAWSAMRSRRDLEALEGSTMRNGEWGAYVDSIGSLREELFLERVDQLAARRVSRNPGVDRIWHAWIRAAGDSLQPKDLGVHLDWDRTLARDFLDSVRRSGGPSIEAGRALPLYGNEWGTTFSAFARVVSTVDPTILRFDSPYGSQDAPIRISIIPFLATTDRTTGHQPIGYRWTTVLGIGRPDSVSFTFVSCDTVIGFAPSGRCPAGGDYDQDSVHTRRGGELRWNDLGTREVRLSGFLRELWGMEP